MRVNKPSRRKPVDPIEQARRYRRLVKHSNIVEARAALNMIREVVEMHAPAGTMPNMGYMIPDIAIEAEVIVKGILAIVRKRVAQDAAIDQAED